MHQEPVFYGWNRRIRKIFNKMYKVVFFEPNLIIIWICSSEILNFFLGYTIAIWIYVCKQRIRNYSCEVKKQVFIVGIKNTKLIIKINFFTWMHYLWFVEEHCDSLCKQTLKKNLIFCNSISWSWLFHYKFLKSYSDVTLWFFMYANP